jgi:hypothetical protein
MLCVLIVIFSGFQPPIDNLIVEFKTQRECEAEKERILKYMSDPRNYNNYKAPYISCAKK